MIGGGGWTCHLIDDKSIGSVFALQHVHGTFFTADGELFVVGGPADFGRGRGHFDGGAERLFAFGAPEHEHAVL